MRNAAIAAMLFVAVVIAYGAGQMAERHRSAPPEPAAVQFICRPADRNGE